MIKINELINPDVQAYYFSFESKEVLVSKQQISNVLGYKNKALPDFIEHTIVESLNYYPDLIEPQGTFAIYPLASENIKKTTIRLGSIDFNTGPIISSYLRGASYAALFIATIGKALESLSRKLINENDYLKGYVLDAIASEAVEAVCDLLEMKISDIVNEEKFNITNRYSPGYCNWHVSEQQKLFSLLPKNACGVSLTESSLMIPVKSVSGIIGIGAKVKKSEYNCSFCGIENCYKKKENE